MAEQTEIEKYNYRDFISSDHFERIYRVDSSAPDCQLILLGKNQSVRLSDYWKKNDLVVEFGSLT